MEKWKAGVNKIKGIGALLGKAGQTRKVSPMFSFYHYIDQLASTDITDHSVRCKHCEHCEHCEPAFEESLPLSISF